jgi:hypothetical protein
MSTAVAAFAWRIWKGQTSALTPGAILLGASFGIRPSLFVYLLPVFLVSVVKGNHPKPALKRSLILVVGTATIGFLAFAWPVGDSHLLWQLAADYLNGETSALRGLLNGDDYRTWIRGFSRFVIWNAIGLTPWILVVAMRRTLPVRRFLKSPAFLFLLVWGLPAFLIQGITTVRSPGLMLPYIPAVCMLSAHFLSLMMPGRAEPRTDTMPAGGFLLASVTIVNTALFLGLFPVISTVSTVSAAVTTPSLSGAISYGLWETTVNSVRSRDEHTARWFYDIGQAGTVAGPRRIVSVEDNAASDSLLNWRVLSYYSDSEIWHIEQDKSNIRASRVFRKDVLERQGGKQVRIPVPRGSRLILIAAPDSWFIREIARQLPVQKQNLAYYVDLPPTFKPDQTSPIVFVPY